MSGLSPRQRAWTPLLLLALSIAAACQISDALDPVGRPCAADQPCGPGSDCDPVSGRCISAAADARSDDLERTSDLGSADRRRTEAGPDLATPPEAGSDLMTPDRLKTDMECPPGSSPCNGLCVDLVTDPLHCGECSKVCALDTDSCEDSACVCGEGGAPCAEGLDCLGGVCVCLAGGRCAGCCQGGACHQLGADQDAGRCGSAGAACESCDDALSCTTDQCLPSGVCENLPRPEGSPCDDGVDCSHSDQCQGGVCSGVAYSCGGGPACADSVCSGDPPPDQCTLSIDPGSCLIADVCYDDEDLNPADPCLQCDVAESPISWVPESEITTCDPLTSAECVPGAGCYIVLGQYLDCVCSPGDQHLGQPCNTSTDCAPGMACFSPTSTPPGECQLLCDPLAGDCASGQPCQVLNNYPTYGTCRD